MCSITVNVTNNTKGPITFNSFSFTDKFKAEFSPDGPPYRVTTAILPNNTAVKALYAEGYLYTSSSAAAWDQFPVVTSGTAVFNMPNGDSLSISWNLNPSSTKNNMPTISPSGRNYSFTGLSNPKISNGDDYVFNLVIS